MGNKMLASSHILCMIAQDDNRLFLSIVFGFECCVQDIFFGVGGGVSPVIEQVLR